MTFTLQIMWQNSCIQLLLGLEKYTLRRKGLHAFIIHVLAYYVVKEGEVNYYLLKYKITICNNCDEIEFLVELVNSVRYFCIYLK